MRYSRYCDLRDEAVGGAFTTLETKSAIAGRLSDALMSRTYLEGYRMLAGAVQSGSALTPTLVKTDHIVSRHTESVVDAAVHLEYWGAPWAPQAPGGRHP